LHTLAQLRSGELFGTRHLSLSENLQTFPLEILSLADSLEVLDLSNNQLTELPAELKQLSHLTIIFASNNQFTHLPEVLGECPQLEMIGFKSNRISHVPETALPPLLRWLILTDNQLETLPDTLGLRPRLQKLALAGNRLTALPETLSQLHELQLVRISANQLSECPDQLLGLPKLAWFACAGNPFTSSDIPIPSVPIIHPSRVHLGKVLGQGASGVISAASWQQKESTFPSKIAMKVFKGDVTSDGYPEDELNACLAVGSHRNLVESLALVKEENYLALVMNLIPEDYYNLGLPPTLDSCTRDTFPKGMRLSIAHIGRIVSQMTDVFEHMHHHYVCHGDLYAHNTLIDNEANMLFGDFGAATMYHMLNDEQKNNMRRIEQRALDYFIDDLLSICIEEDRHHPHYDALRQRIASSDISNNNGD